MTSPAILYRRLPGRTRAPFSQGQTALYAADDHLLYVISATFVENSKRFYYRDIQAITITRTVQGAIGNLLLGIPAFLISLYVISLATSSVSTAAIAFGICVLPFLVMIGINVALGPSCVCRVHTAVQAEDLQCLRRLRTARKVAAQLRPMIEAAQGAFPVDESSRESEDLVVTVPSPRALNAAVDATPVHHEDGRLHGWLFALVLFMALLYSISLVYRDTFTLYLRQPLMIALIVFAILAFRRQRSSDLPVSVCAISWAVMGEIVALFTFAQFALKFTAMLDSPGSANLEIMRIRYLEGPVGTVFYAVSAMVLAVTGMLGLMELRRFRADQTQPTPSPAAQDTGEPAPQVEGTPDA